MQRTTELSFPSRGPPVRRYRHGDVIVATLEKPNCEILLLGSAEKESPFDYQSPPKGDSDGDHLAANPRFLPC